MMPTTRVLILYNRSVLPPGHPHADSEAGVLDTVHAVREALSRAGFEAKPLGLGRQNAPLLLDALRANRPAAVVNLFEGFPDDPDSEPRVARLLEAAGVPFTGSGARALERSRDKAMARRLLERGGVPVAPGFIVEGLPVPPCPLDFPVIVKPARCHASEGIDQQSVATDPAALERRVAALLTTFGPPVVVETLLPGREFLVALTELPTLRALPIAEFRFVAGGSDAWPIATYESKWCPGSRDYEAMLADYPARDVPEALADRLVEVAVAAYRRLDCRDYARVDLRLTAAGEPAVLEVNANPDLSPTACLTGALEAAGEDYTAFLTALVAVARGRG